MERTGPRTSIRTTRKGKMLFQRRIRVFLVAVLCAALRIGGCFCFVVQPATIPRASLQVAQERTNFVRLSSSKSDTKSDRARIEGNSATSSSSSSTRNSSPGIPANLRRKVHAPRPGLGHVVGKNGIKIRTSGGRTSGGSASNPLPLYQQGKRKNQNQARNNNGRKQQQSTHRLLTISSGTAKGRKLDSPSVYLRPMMAKVREAVFSTLTSFGLYDTNSIGGGKGSSGKASSSSNLLRHLDLFAGSGSVGLESLSRGASHCTFVDLAEDCCDTIRRNAVHCQFLDNEADGDYGSSSSNRRVTVVNADVMQVLEKGLSLPMVAALSQGHEQARPFDLVTICPPYEEVVYADLLDAVVSSPLVTENTVVMVEYPVELGNLPHVITSSSLPAPLDAAAASERQDSDALALPRRYMIGVRNRRYGRTVIAMYVINPSDSRSSRLDPDMAFSRPEEFV